MNSMALRHTSTRASLLSTAPRCSMAAVHVGRRKFSTSAAAESTQNRTVEYYVENNLDHPDRWWSPIKDALLKSGFTESQFQEWRKDLKTKEDPREIVKATLKQRGIPDGGNLFDEAAKARLAWRSDKLQNDIYFPDQYQDKRRINRILMRKDLTPEQAEKVIALAHKHDNSDFVFYSQLGHIYARNKDIEGTVGVLKRMRNGGFSLTTGIFSSVAYAYFQHKNYDKVLEAYDEMNTEGYRPKLTAYLLALASSRYLGKKEKETEIMTQMEVDGYKEPEGFKEKTTGPQPSS